MNKTLLASVVGLLVGSFALADDWPQFRGPDRNGLSKEKKLLTAWPKGGPTLVWTYKDAGLGHSSFAIVKGVLYTLGTDYDAKNPNDSAKDEYVIAIDAKKGTEIWRAKIGPLYTYKGNSYGDGPRATPTIDGSCLYALGGQGDLVCFDIANKGKEVWRTHLVKDLDGVIMEKYGFSESPLIDGKLLICTPGGNQGTLAALDKKKGTIVWRSKAWTEMAPYSSVTVAEIQGVRQYLQMGYTGGNAGGSVAGVDKAGNLLWKMKIFSGDNDGIGTSPVVKGNQVYVTAGFGGGCHLFDINAKQVAAEQYTKKAIKTVKNTHGGVVLIDDHIYGHTENQSWVCQELATGAEKWLERDALKCQSGAVVAAEGLLYLYTDDGEMALVSATPQAFNVISSFTIPQRSAIPGNRSTSRQSRIWAHPVIANGHLFARDHDLIFAFKIAN